MIMVKTLDQNLYLFQSIIAYRAGENKVYGGTKGRGTEAQRDQKKQETKLRGFRKSIGPDRTDECTASKEQS